MFYLAVSEYLFSGFYFLTFKRKWQIYFFQLDLKGKQCFQAFLVAHCSWSSHTYKGSTERYPLECLICQDHRGCSLSIYQYVVMSVLFESKIGILVMFLSLRQQYDTPAQSSGSSTLSSVLAKDVRKLSLPIFRPVNTQECGPEHLGQTSMLLTSVV